MKSLDMVIIVKGSEQYTAEIWFFFYYFLSTLLGFEHVQELVIFKIWQQHTTYNYGLD